MKHVISDGIGTQSWTMKQLAKRGILAPMPVEAVFADTKDERRKVYDYLDQQRNKFPFPITAISIGKLSDAALKVRTSKASGKNYLKHHIPVFIRRSSGKLGMMGRACTLDFKIEPIRRYLRDSVIGKGEYLAWRKKHKDALRLLGLYKLQKSMKKKGLHVGLPIVYPHAAWKECQDDALVCLWIGISTDEIDRAKDSVVPWILNRHPLTEIGYDREKCISWLSEVGEPEPPDSSCKYCPYHSDDKWIRMREEAPEEFEEAAVFEEDYQKSFAQCDRLDGVPYLHDSRKPLRQVVLVSGRRSSAEQTPCKGICGV